MLVTCKSNTTSRNRDTHESLRRLKALQAAFAEENLPEVDLQWLGVDADTVRSIDSMTAASLGVIPVDRVDGKLVIAVSQQNLLKAKATLVPMLAGTKLAFVIADSTEVAALIEQVYQPMALSA